MRYGCIPPINWWGLAYQLPKIITVDTCDVCPYYRTEEVYDYNTRIYCKRTGRLLCESGSSTMGYIHPSCILDNADGSIVTPRRCERCGSTQVIYHDPVYVDRGSKLIIGMECIYCDHIETIVVEEAK